LSRKPNKWTDDALAASAGRYDDLKTWRTSEPSAYATASQRNLLSELTAHMHKRVVHGYWTEERIFESAKNFDQISKWAEAHPAAYAKAGKLGVRGKATAHMTPVGNRVKRCVYIIRVHGTNLAYVGLTGNIKRRFRDHLKTKRFSKLAADHGLDAIICKQISEYILAEDAQRLEYQTYLDCLSDGLELLNNAPTGSLGGTTIKWTREAILTEAKRYKTVKGWINSKTRSYAAAAGMGIIDEAAAHMKRQIKKPGSWTKGEIIVRASKFSQISEWIKNDQASYGAATRSGLLDDPDVVGHFKKGEVVNRKWTKEATLSSALKFTTRAAWKANYAQAYKAARKYGWFEEATSHMTFRPKPEPKWTKVAVLQDAKRFKHKSEWRKSSGGAHAAALKNGWYKEATKHMEVLNPKWKWSSKSAIIRDAKKHKSRSAWMRVSSGAYEAAKKLGYFEEAVAHMNVLRKRWSAKEILSSVGRHQKLSEWRKENEGRYRAAVKANLVEQVKKLIVEQSTNRSG
tara:strand:+ start:206 stop:1750 length:1545 start_codon:yes stop_codon:yes gene_type:complete